MDVTPADLSKILPPAPGRLRIAVDGDSLRISIRRGASSAVLIFLLCLLGTLLLRSSSRSELLHLRIAALARTAIIDVLTSPWTLVLVPIGFYFSEQFVRMSAEGLEVGHRFLWWRTSETHDWLKIVNLASRREWGRGTVVTFEDLPYGFRSTLAGLKDGEAQSLLRTIEAYRRLIETPGSAA